MYTLSVFVRHQEDLWECSDSGAATAKFKATKWRLVPSEVTAVVDADDHRTRGQALPVIHGSTAKCAEIISTSEPRFRTHAHEDTYAHGEHTA